MSPVSEPRSSTSAAGEAALRVIGRRADQLLLVVLVLGTGVALWLGLVYGRPGTALAWGLPLLGGALLAYLLAAGRLWARMAMALAGVGLVALQIQLSMGALEYHFGVFVLLAFLLAYRDWRPIVFAAGLAAVHHIAFDRLQLAGLPFYCLSEPDFGRILVHAAFVVVQTGVEIFMAQRMRADALESAELQALCALDASGELSLDVHSVAVCSPAGVALRRALLQLDAAVAAVHQAAESVSAATLQIATGNQDLSRRTEQTASHLQEAAASMEQLDGAVQHSAQEATVARELAVAASQMAGQCGQVVSQVVSTMDAIHDSAQRIADIVGVIDGIAFQTNILALNAAVEAARAGTQGRGFAVVAAEVRALAQRSAQAAHEVRGLIAASLERADRGTQLVADAGRSMGEVVGSAQRVSEMVGGISQAVAGQSGDIGRVSHSVLQLDRMTQQNAALVEQSTAAADSLTQQAARLLQVVGSFKFRHLDEGKAGGNSAARHVPGLALR
jgi:methyl-accepting chemotaxis protein